MGLTFGFFDSVNGDRKYSADDIGRYLQGIVTSGVFADDINNFKVLADTNMQVEVQPGRAMLDCHYLENDAPLPLVLSAGGTLDRIDAIVMRLDRERRLCEIAVKTGTPASTPTAPEMLRTDTVKEYMLASVFVSRLSSAIVQENITDTRADPNVCGWVMGLLNPDVLGLPVPNASDAWKIPLVNEAGNGYELHVPDTTLTRAGRVADAAAVGKAIQKAAPHNLLDNSYFRNPVNQRGQTVYTTDKYTIDRWFSHTNNESVTLNSNGITIKAKSGVLGWFSQKLEGSKFLGKTYTAAIKLANGKFVLATGTFPNSYPASDTVVARTDTPEINVNLLLNAAQTVSFGHRINGGTVTIEWAALYEGEYTAETLPEYKPKGYAAELQECQRYFVAFNGNDAESVMLTDGATNGTTFYAFFPLPVAMRGTGVPTVTYSKVDIYPYTVGIGVAVTDLSAVTMPESRNSICVRFGHASSNMAAKTPGTLRLSAGGYIHISMDQ